MNKIDFQRALDALLLSKALPDQRIHYEQFMIFNNRILLDYKKKGFDAFDALDPNDQELSLTYIADDLYKLQTLSVKSITNLYEDWGLNPEFVLEILKQENIL